jgi:hypothetical protein
MEDLVLLLMRLIPALLVAVFVSAALFLVVSFVGDVTGRAGFYPFRDTLTGMVFGCVMLCMMTPYGFGGKLVLGAYLLMVVSRWVAARVNAVLLEACWRHRG